MLHEFLEKLESLYPDHTFAWETVISANLEILKQLHIDGQPAALWAYPEKLMDLVTGGKETAEENFNTTLNSFIKFVDEYFNPPSKKSTDAASTS
jgi:hypothetical protein